MSWILWAQIMGLVMWVGLWTRYVVKGPEKSKTTGEADRG